ncbi:hypothetical protein S14_237 [Shewanella sp. phage 1/4]|uniref:hypothetical protein n=1 Tax=Shewanella phage 1/4 TaxID=1458859 RepID=UPI0004F8FC73|nr:hypothetical protein S14_237 [Shewanella sp. phage 1/4]AHK11346.1 hypothetical protein S14_237 [Shewanella sp. phage 1/4]
MVSLSNTFDKIPVQLRQAEIVQRIDISQSKELTLKLDLSHKLIYCYLFSRFTYNTRKKIKTTMSVEYIALQCGTSESTVKRKIKDLKQFGIITYSTGRSKSGHHSRSIYSEVVDLVNDDRYKLKSAKLIKFFRNAESKRDYLIDLFHIEKTDPSWSSLQLKYFMLNKHYELMTGLYLKGDKTSGMLYDKKLFGVTFTMQDELRDNDFKILFDLRNEQRDNPILENEDIKQDEEQVYDRELENF